MKLTTWRLHSAERVRRSSIFSVGCGSKRENYKSLKFVGKGFMSERERENMPRFHLGCEGERSCGFEGPCGSGNWWKRSSNHNAHEEHFEPVLKNEQVYEGVFDERNVAYRFHRCHMWG